MKKIFAILLAFVMILSFAACGAKETPKPEEKPQENPASGGNVQPSGNTTASSGNIVLTNDFIKFICETEWVSIDDNKKDAEVLKFEEYGKVNDYYWAVNGNQLSVMKSLGNAKFETLEVFNIIENYYGTTILEKATKGTANAFADTYARKDAEIAKK